VQLSGGKLGGDVEVYSGATLAGDPTGASTGTVAANVNVHSGGTLGVVAGGSAKGLAIGGNLTLAAGATTAITLATPSTTAAVGVTGNLALDGTLDLSAGASFNSGTYRLYDYGGSLSGAGLTLGTTPAHSLFAVDTATTGQVNLAVAAGLWWNGSTTTSGGSAVNGGTGTWDGSGATTNWTNSAGSSANAWNQGSLGIFAGTAGTVTVSNSAVPQAAGLEFLTTGYTVTGGEIALASFHGNPVTRVLVEDSAAAGGGTATIASVVSGSQTLEKIGTGTLVLTGTNTYTGGTKVTAGTLQIGDGGTAGSLVGAIANNATLVFDRSDNIVNGGAITGSGALVKRGAGSLTLTGSNSAGAGTTIASGTLALDNGSKLTSDVTVKSGSTLAAPTSGSGATVAGIVTVLDGGTLSTAATAAGPGLSTAGLVFSHNAHLTVDLGANAGTAAVSTGTLTLDGVLDVSSSGSLMQGVYRIIDYTTLAADNGLQIGTTPSSFTYQIQRQTGQVNLAVSSTSTGGSGNPGTGGGTTGGGNTGGGSLAFWNGSQVAANGVVSGGSGTWRNDPALTNWTDAAARQAQPWNGTYAVFTANAGTVTVDAANGPVSVTGAQFATDGYLVTGGGITLAGTSGQTQIRVGDGTAAGAAMVARVYSPLGGLAGLEKVDRGTLILGGDNTYTGGTTVTSGTLQIGDGGTSGSLQGDVINNATLVFFRSDDTAFAGAISGSGAVIKRGAGTLLMTGANTYAGGLTIADGTVLVGAASALGNGPLSLEGVGTLRVSTGFTDGRGISLTAINGQGGGGVSVDGNETLVLTGVISGSGALNKSGSGTLVLTGANSFTGSTTVSDGLLMIGGGSSLSDTARLNVLVGAALNLTDADETVGSLGGGGSIKLNGHCLNVGGDGMSSTFSGSISGSGCLTKTGAGTMNLSGRSDYTGTTTIADGKLQVANAAALGTGPLALQGPGTLRASGTFTDARAISLTPINGQGGGTFEVDNAQTLTLTGQIAGLGNLAKTGTGTLILGGANTYTGDTQVKAGILNVASNLVGNVFVQDKATLMGGGTIGQTVHVLDGGTLVGRAGSGLTMGGLDLAGKATLAVTLAAPSENGVFQINGNATLGGTLAVTTANTLDLGVYRVANYTGTVTDTGMKVSGLAADQTGEVQTSQANKINLVVDSSKVPVSFWNGSSVVPGQAPLGGTGTWKADATSNWANSNANANDRWPSAFAVFQGNAGTATVDNSIGQVTARGMQFVDSGFVVQGDPITLTNNGPATIRVGDGTTSGVNTVATISSVLTGNVGVVKTDLGTLVLTGTNTFTGTTTISQGTLQLGDGGTTGSVAGAIVDNARLVVARSDTTEFRGQVSGAGQVEFRGGKVLYGDGGKFTGSVTARDAFVRLDPGAVTSAPFTLESGSVLGGTATIGALAANAGSTVAPGYSPGTISVNGAVAFNAGATYAVDVTPDGQHDLITATGPVTLSSQAQVKVHATPGRYAANSLYAIVTTTATVTGRFSGVTSDYAFLKPSLSYDAQNVYLGLTYNERKFSDFARTGNQFAVAVAAQGLGMGNRVFDTLLNLPEGQVARAFERLDGEGHASLNTVIQQQSVYLRDAVGARLRQSGAGDDALAKAARSAGPATQSAEGDPNRTLWAQAYGGFGRRLSNGNAGAIASSAGGMLAGLDVALGDAVRVGVLGGLGRSSIDVPSRDTTGSFANYDVGLYGSGRLGALAVRGGFAQSWHDVTARRSVTIPGFGGSESARYTVAGSQVFGEVSTDVALGATTLQPFAGVSYVTLDGHRVNERGSGASALSGTVRSQDVTSTTLGARAATQVRLGDVVLTPSVTLGWQHAFGDLAPGAKLALAGGSPFTVSGVPVVQDMAVVGAGLSYDLSDLSAIRVNYTGQLAPKATQNSFTAEYAHRF
jgi:autotransporter-associated beta strand protein